MFVTSSPSFRHAGFSPKAPKPLQPIFTYAQSQSCMNLGLGMDMLDHREHGRISSGRLNSGRTHSGRQVFCGSEKELQTEKAEGWFEALSPTRPQMVYKSPLQRIGEALRAPLLGSTSALVLNIDMRKSAPPPTPPTSPDLQYGEISPTGKHPNFSYKLLPGGNTTPNSPMRPGLRQDSAGSPGRTSNRLIGTPTPRNNGCFAGTGLHSSLFSSNPRTRAPFKPQKSNRGTSTWQLKQYAEATLGSGSLRKAVKLPEGEDKDEWLAVNGELATLIHFEWDGRDADECLLVVDFYNQINLLYGSITEFCSPQSCPEMKATDE
jgi:MOB kinase activator 1